MKNEEENITFIFSTHDARVVAKARRDAVRLQYFTSPSSRAEIAIKAEKNGVITGAALYRLNHWKYDFQGLAGVYTQSDLVLGLGWAGQIAGGGFKGEFSFSLMNNLDLSIIAQSFQSYDPPLYGYLQTSVFIRLKGSF